MQRAISVSTPFVTMASEPGPHRASITSTVSTCRKGIQSDRLTSGDDVGNAVGESEGMVVVGESDGALVLGATVGIFVDDVDVRVGEIEGCDKVGDIERDGAVEGDKDGRVVDGSFEGDIDNDGETDGVMEDETVGKIDGRVVGVLVALRSHSCSSLRMAKSPSG